MTRSWAAVHWVGMDAMGARVRGGGLIDIELQLYARCV